MCARDEGSEALSEMDILTWPRRGPRRVVGGFTDQIRHGSRSDWVTRVTSVMRISCSAASMSWNAFHAPRRGAKQPGSRREARVGALENPAVQRSFDRTDKFTTVRRWRADDAMMPDRTSASGGNR